MTDRKTRKPKIEKLALKKETVQDLTEEEAEAVRGASLISCKTRAPLLIAKKEN